MHIEFEAKVYGIDIDDCRIRLARQGFFCTAPLRMMKRVVFDNPIRPDSFFRIRDEGDSITCTYKQLGEKSSIDQVQEINCTVSDFLAMQNIFVAIGHTPKSYQETQRESYLHADGTECCIDIWPGLEPFLEIEGESEQKVREHTQALGYEYTACVFGAVDTIYEQFAGIPRAEINTMKTIEFSNPPKKI